MRPWVFVQRNQAITMPVAKDGITGKLGFMDWGWDAVDNQVMYAVAGDSSPFKAGTKK